jgi:outer membrane protein assembly factor BamA
MARTRMLMRRFAMLAVICWPTWSHAQGLPSFEELEADGAIIGTIHYDIQPIFDTDDERENGWLYRQLNRFHISTKQPVIEAQLTFQSGEAFEQRKLEETERILRQNRYLHEAQIRPTRYRDGVVDITVTTHELWTLTPGLSVYRSGGENRIKVEIEELNLLGTGAGLTLERRRDFDRTSVGISYRNRNLARTRAALGLAYFDADDGKTQDISLIRPFFSLDSRWSAGFRWFDQDRDERIFSLGESAAAFHKDQRFVDAFGGWSAGLKNDWTRRYLVGFVANDVKFSAPIATTLPALLPTDRRLNYPYLGFELVQNRFETIENLQQIGRTEDIFLGSRISGRVGWSATGLGANQEGLVYALTAQRGFGSPLKHLLLVDGGVSGRRENSRSTNVLSNARARYAYRRSEKSLAFASVSASFGQRLDTDNLQVLGGSSGLRGYPQRYQTGDSRALITIEQRYYTDWYPFRLVRVGGAVFFDAGRTWGINPAGEENQGWLKDIGFGLRLGSTRGISSKTIHLDLAFPLDGDNSIDSVQLLLEAKQTF